MSLFAEEWNASNLGVVHEQKFEMTAELSQIVLKIT
jgi:hypothetical protein